MDALNSHVVIIHPRNPVYQLLPYGLNEGNYSNNPGPPTDKLLHQISYVWMLPIPESRIWFKIRKIMDPIIWIIKANSSTPTYSDMAVITIFTRVKQRALVFLDPLINIQIIKLMAA